jgi:hypothetical protein
MKKLAQNWQHQIQKEGEKYYMLKPRNPPHTRKVAQKWKHKIQSEGESTTLQPENTEDLRRAAAKAINSVLKKKLKLEDTRFGGLNGGEH